MQKLKKLSAIIFIGITLASLLFFGINLYRYYSIQETYNSVKNQLPELLRENRELQNEIKEKKLKIAELKKQQESLQELLKKYRHINSPESVGKKITEICVKNNVQIVAINSSFDTSKNFLLNTSVILKGREGNILKTVNDIVNSFPMSLQQFNLLNDNGTNLQMVWNTPRITYNREEDEKNKN